MKFNLNQTAVDHILPLLTMALAGQSVGLGIDSALMLMAACSYAAVQRIIYFLYAAPVLERFPALASPAWSMPSQALINSALALATFGIFSIFA